MAAAVFSLCAVTSITCFALLVRAYRSSGSRLVFWSAVCFGGLAVNNLLLAFNELILPHVDMPWRGAPGAVGLAALVYGLAAEQRRAGRAGRRSAIARRRRLPVA